MSGQKSDCPRIAFIVFFCWATECNSLVFTSKMDYFSLYYDENYCLRMINALKGGKPLKKHGHSENQNGTGSRKGTVRIVQVIS